MKWTKYKHAVATSRGNGHTATAIRDREPRFIGKHGLKRTDSLCSSYSMDHIAMTCYNLQVTSYCALV